MTTIAAPTGWGESRPTKPLALLDGSEYYIQTERSESDSEEYPFDEHDVDKRLGHRGNDLLETCIWRYDDDDDDKGYFAIPRQMPTTSSPSLSVFKTNSAFINSKVQAGNTVMCGPPREAEGRVIGMHRPSGGDIEFWRKHRDADNANDFNKDYGVTLEGPGKKDDETWNIDDLDRRVEKTRASPENLSHDQNAIFQQPNNRKIVIPCTKEGVRFFGSIVLHEVEKHCLSTGKDTYRQAVKAHMKATYETNHKWMWDAFDNSRFKALADETAKNVKASHKAKVTRVSSAVAEQLTPAVTHEFSSLKWDQFARTCDTDKQKSNEARYDPFLELDRAHANRKATPGAQRN